MIAASQTRVLSHLILVLLLPSPKRCRYLSYWKEGIQRTMELLNEQEFKDDSETNPYNESSTKPVDFLLYQEEDLEKKKIFFQVPKTMPLPNPALKDAAGSSITKACNLSELPTSFMRKMLVYKSGAVKLKVGDHLYNVTGGLDCSFSQDVVAMDTEEKHCFNIGEVNKHAIIAPDINSILENLKDL
nr:DNA-directed RNA polymerase III subunit RPC4 [Tanacetum cinerariifolium]